MIPKPRSVWCKRRNPVSALGVGDNGLWKKPKKKHTLKWSCVSGDLHKKNKKKTILWQELRPPDRIGEFFAELYESIMGTLMIECSCTDCMAYELSLRLQKIFITVWPSWFYSFQTYCNHTEAGRNNSLVPCLHKECYIHYCYGNREHDQDGGSMIRVYRLNT